MHDWNITIIPDFHWITTDDACMCIITEHCPTEFIIIHCFRIRIWLIAISYSNAIFISLRLLIFLIRENLLIHFNRRIPRISRHDIISTM